MRKEIAFKVTGPGEHGTKVCEFFTIGGGNKKVLVKSSKGSMLQRRQGQCELPLLSLIHVAHPTTLFLLRAGGSVLVFAPKTGQTP